ncbi:NADPH-dependent F420 reductase [Kitasatospora sp. NBC_01560]|uniref:NADPH-dependent F420 reductase n=1 Tax=Kitasatospora sp. NBC_01560 TaxID=2975965 RepID=UPI003867A792
MRIGIIGAGNMAQGLGRQWAAAGHEVAFGARDAARAAAAAAHAGAGARAVAGPAAAAAFGEAVLLAVPAERAEEVVAAAAPPAGRVLIDCTNPIAPGLVLTTAGGPSMAERIAAAAPGTHVVKAFNVCHESVWRLTPPVFDGRPLAVPLCGDDPAALALVGRLVAGLGAEPVPAGGLDRAGLLEAATAFAIGLWFAGRDVRALFPPLAHAGGTG